MMMILLIRPSPKLIFSIWAFVLEKKVINVDSLKSQDQLIINYQH